MSREGGHSGVVTIVEAIAEERDKDWACKVEFRRWGFVYEWRLTNHPKRWEKEQS